MIFQYISLYICVAFLFTQTISKSKREADNVDIRTKFWELEIYDLESQSYHLLEYANVTEGANNILLSHSENSVTGLRGVKPKKKGGRQSTKRKLSTKTPKIEILLRRLSLKLSKLNASETMYPEIVIYLHDSFYKQFKDYSEMVAYVHTLMFGVDRNFRSITKPRIRLNIVGIIVVKIYENNVDAQKIFIKDVRKHTQSFCKNEGCHSDIDVLIVGDETLLTTDETFTVHMCAACLNFSYAEFNEVSSLSVFDDTKFSGILSLTRGIAAMFCAFHDEPDFLVSLLGKPYAKSCTKKPGFIMAPNENDVQKLIFSPCSKKLMKAFFRSEQARCLWYKPSVDEATKEFVKLLPGEFMSLDKQCENMGFARASQVTETVCYNILCETNGMIHNNSIRKPALEGSSCGSNKYCIRGECVLFEKQEEIQMEKNKHKKETNATFSISGANYLYKNYREFFKFAIYWLVTKCLIANY